MAKCYSEIWKCEIRGPAKHSGDNLWIGLKIFIYPRGPSPQNMDLQNVFLNFTGRESYGMKYTAFGLKN